MITEHNGHMIACAKIAGEYRASSTKPGVPAVTADTEEEAIELMKQMIDSPD